VRRDQGLVQLKEFSLYPDRAFDRGCGGIERRENRIAGVVVDAPPMLSYGCGENIQVPFESTMCSIFVECTESTVVGNVGVDDRGLMPRKRVLIIAG